MALFASSLRPAAGCVAAVLGAYYVWCSHQRRRKNILSPEQSINSLLLNENTRCSCIYLDYNGTTPIHPLVLKAMLSFFTHHFGNPSSSHYFGRIPKMAVDGARKSLLTLLGETPTAFELSSIWFTGCGTESDNLAIQIAIQSNPSMITKHIVASNVEHPAIEVCLKALEQAGVIQVTFVPVGPNGCVTAHDMISAMQPNTILVTLMLANNESGALQPVKEVAEECRRRGTVLFHTDAAQAAGKVSVSVKDMGYPDMVTLVGHKIGAPKGVAALYVRPHCYNQNGRSLPEKCILLYGGGQEHGRRGGTENVPYIVGLGKAAEVALIDLERNARHMETMRSRLLENLKRHLGEENVRPNGPMDASLRLPNTLSVGIKGVQSGNLLRTIGDDVAASAGAACHSTGGDISAVLRAMNVSEDFARGTLRLSVGPTITAAEIDQASLIIAKEAKRQMQQL